MKRKDEKDQDDKLPEDSEPDLLAETAEKGIDASVVPLSEIYRYLSQFAVQQQERARTVPPIDLSLRRFGVVSGLRPVDFRVNQSFSDTGSEVSLLFRLVRDTPVNISCQVSAGDEDIPAALRRNGIVVLSSRIRTGEGGLGVLSMEVAPDFPIRVIFKGMLGSERIVIEATNVWSVGERVFQIAPEEIDSYFFELLGKLLSFESRELIDRLEEAPPESLVIPSPGVEQTVQTEPVSANILTFDLSQRIRHKTLRLIYQGEEFVFDRTHPVCRLGRRMPADIQVRSRFVSREHATLILENRQFMLRDHSSNGTYVRPEGKPTYMLHHVSQRLEGVGVISLGEEISPGNPDLIYYEVGE